MWNAIADNVSSVVAPTDLVPLEEGSQQPFTDVVYFSDNYNGPICGATWHSSGSQFSDGLGGIAICAVENANDCDQFWVFMDASFIDQVLGNDAEQIRGLVCHETGHTLGLRHPNVNINGATTDTCVDNSLDGLMKDYISSHDTKHINDNY